MVLDVWLGITYTNTCFMKWSWNTKMLATLGDSFSSMVVSMLVKSTCKRSRGVVAMIRCRGALDKLLLCCKQHMQILMECCMWLAIPGHQKHSCNREQSMFMVLMSCISMASIQGSATQCAFGTKKSRRSSFSPLGIEHRYRAFWWIVKFSLIPQDQLALLTEGMLSSVFRSVFFWVSNQSKTVHSALDLLSGLLLNQSCVLGLIHALQQHGPLAPIHSHP